MRKLFFAAPMLLLALGASAMAQPRCRVMDPTGTPLNVRTGPGGTIMTALPNGVLVAVVEQVQDAKGRAWVHIKTLDDNVTLGWVYREFISCF